MKVAILTTFQDFNPSYSLTGIVADQVRMLARHGDEVHLFVNEQWNPGHGDPTVGGLATLHTKVPFAHLTDYKSIHELKPEHRETVGKTVNMLVEELTDFDIVFSHDWVFTGWNLPYALAIMKAGQDAAMQHVRWLHWIHSIPSALSDWWEIHKYGPKHRLVFPNKADRIRVAEQYRGEMHHVEVIPHIKDLRTWFDFGEDTCRFIDEYPAVMQADVVQILPASVDRLHRKGVNEVILIFAKLKKMGFNVCLVIANQWATERVQKKDIDHYLVVARRNGLEPGVEVIFTSLFEAPNFEVGLPKKMIRELFQCSNLFVFPTMEESFGLVVPEAILAGGVLPVLNKSLKMQMEITGFLSLYFDFGSHEQTLNCPDKAKYCSDVAQIIVGRMRQNESLMCKTFVRQQYNMDRLYDQVYAPVMKASITW